MSRILVIEDELNINSSICELLELEDYEPISALNGKQGIVLAIKEQPDLILCDIMMPEMTGLEVIETLRKTRLFDHTPFIFLSALSDRQDIRRGMNLGANDYIPKPFEAEDILSAIKQQLERRHSRLKEQENLKKQLKEREQALQKHSFLNSHKLRGPISNLLGLLQIAEEMSPLELIKLLRAEAQKIDDIVIEINANLSMKNTTRKTTSLIYLVDDDQLQHRINSVVIKRITPEAQLLQFENGFEAIAEMKMAGSDEIPDVILLDLNMPVMDGFDFLEAFKNLGLPHSVDIYILSSSIDQKDIEHCMQYDAVKGYFSKPLRKDQIERILKPN